MSLLQENNINNRAHKSQGLHRDNNYSVSVANELHEFYYACPAVSGAGPIVGALGVLCVY